nr:putative peptidyl-tRNA hydrolase PTRHD1 isoform X2 [Salvelinus alpinus]
MAASGTAAPRRLVQYVVVRSDLVHTLAWPLGAVITQACHAAIAAIHLNYNDPDTQEYLAELDSMHKVVLQVAGTGVLLLACCGPGLPLQPVRDADREGDRPQAVD